MINKNDLPKTTVKQLAYENRTFLRAYLPVEPRYSQAEYEVCHNGMVWKFTSLETAVAKFNQEVANDM